MKTVMTNPEYNPLTSSEDQRCELGDCDTSDHDSNELIEDSTERVKIIILDSAQQKFSISVNPDWSVNQLKIEGETIHKVPPASQRLIYRGKMLDDSKLLRDVGIDKDNLILHLFVCIHYYIYDDIVWEIVCLSFLTFFFSLSGPGAS